MNEICHEHKRDKDRYADPVEWWSPCGCGVLWQGPQLHRGITHSHYYITTVQGPVTQVTNFSTVPSPTSQTWLGTRDHSPLVGTDRTDTTASVHDYGPSTRWCTSLTQIQQKWGGHPWSHLHRSSRLSILCDLSVQHIAPGRSYAAAKFRDSR